LGQRVKRTPKTLKGFANAFGVSSKRTSTESALAFKQLEFRDNLLMTMIAISRFALFLAVSSSIVCAQQAGSASKGGSIRLEKAERAPRSNLQTLAALYRPLVRQLDVSYKINLNFTELVDEYDAARKTNRDIKFETVIIAYIAAEQQSSSENDPGKAVVQALKPARNNLALALQRVFSLTEEQAKSQAREAVDRYKEAERQVRRH
jgi:hypothetical protein